MLPTDYQLTTTEHTEYTEVEIKNETEYTMDPKIYLLYVSFIPWFNFDHGSSIAV